MSQETGEDQESPQQLMQQLSGMQYEILENKSV
jgi:Ras-related protein Rab-2A